MSEPFTMQVPLTRSERERRRRPSLFSRMVGVIGELLITVALVLVGFIVWELYGTTWEVEGPRAEVIATYEQEHPPATQEPGVVFTEEPPPYKIDFTSGRVYGLVHVPSWNWMKMPLAEGTGENVLDMGWAGHYPESVQAGEIGNFAIAGHRRTYGNNFRWVDRFVPGDVVVIELDDRYVVYEVDSYEIVEATDPTNVRVIAPVIGDETWTQVPTERWMTMTTCHPEYSDTHRYAVHLKFKSWTPKSSGIPAELADEPRD